MRVTSIFEFRFPEAARDEGLALVRAIGADMELLDGYLGHDVIQDLNEAAISW